MELLLWINSGIVLRSVGCGSRGSKRPNGSMVIAIKCLDSTEHTLGSGRADLLMNFILNSCWMKFSSPSVIWVEETACVSRDGLRPLTPAKTVRHSAWPARVTENHFGGLSPLQRRISGFLLSLRLGRHKQLTARLSRRTFSNGAGLF